MSYTSTSLFSKILEIIIYNRLYSFLSEDNILYKKRFGFQQQHSTDNVIVHLLNGNNWYTLVAFTDLTKAFDMVDHNIILKKINNWVPSNNLKLLQSNLQNRKQHITYQNTSKGG